MTFWKDKQGNELTFKQFTSRWKSGVESVSPLQQTKIQLNSTWIIIVGLAAGIVISVINYKTLWWLLLILIGGLGNTLVQLLGLWQKKNILSQFESFEPVSEPVKGGFENEIKEEFENKEKEYFGE